MRRRIAAVLAGMVCIGFASDALALNHIESQTYPLHVYFNSEKSLAIATLAAMEASWKTLVVEAGFTEPWMEDENHNIVHGVRAEIASMGYESLGGAFPVGDVPETPACDCTAALVFSPNMPLAAVSDSVAHEFVHTIQWGIDCGEAFSAMEPVAEAIGQTQFPNTQYFNMFLSTFQDFPDYPLDFVQFDITTDPKYYQWGAALYPVFLLERFGGGDLKFFAKLWNAYPQNGTMSLLGSSQTCSNPNKPNWFDGTDQVLKEMGSSFDEAFDEFSAWRAITGSHDDGAHFKKGAEYASAKSAASHTLDSLPITGDMDLHEYGSRHIELHPGAYAGPIRVNVTGAPEGAWGGSLLLWKADKPVQRIILTFEDELGSASIDWDSDVVRGLLIVTHKNFAGHNPDDMIFDVVRPFTYTIDLPSVEPQPEPALEAGADVEIDAPEQVDAATAADSAKESGSNPSQQDSATVGQDASSEAGVSAPLPTSGATEDSGCGCELSGRTRSVGGLLLSLPLLVVGFAVRRLKRRTSPPQAARSQNRTGKESPNRV